MVKEAPSSRGTTRVRCPDAPGVGHVDASNPRTGGKLRIEFCAYPFYQIALDALARPEPAPARGWVRQEGPAPAGLLPCRAPTRPPPCRRVARWPVPPPERTTTP